MQIKLRIERVQRDETNKESWFIYFQFSISCTVLSNGYIVSIVSIHQRFKSSVHIIWQNCNRYSIRALHWLIMTFCKYITLIFLCWKVRKRFETTNTLSELNSVIQGKLWCVLHSMKTVTYVLHFSGNI